MKKNATHVTQGTIDTPTRGGSHPCQSHIQDRLPTDHRDLVYHKGQLLSLIPGGATF